jgi:hypothetical protein
MNGYQACERISQVFQYFNNLPDYDDYINNKQTEEEHLSAIKKLLLDSDHPAETPEIGVAKNPS